MLESPFIFSWLPAYKQIIQKLPELKNNQDKLLLTLKELDVDVLSDKDDAGNFVSLTEIDAFTFLCALNKFGDDKRRTALNKLCKKWDIDITVYDVSGLPNVHAQKLWMFPYKNERNNNEIERLWDFFISTLNDSVTDEKFVDILTINSVGKQKITEVMFMAAPDRFLCLNGVVKPYLERKGINTEFATYSEMVELLNKVKDKLRLPFHEISYNAFRESIEEKTQPVFWRIGTTEGDSGQDVLPEMLDNKVASIGWSHLGDLEDISPLNKTNLTDILMSTKTYDYKPKASAKAGEILDFKLNIKINDYVLACRGGEVRAIGKILHSLYIYQPDLVFVHCRAIDWIKKDVQNLNIRGLQQTVNRLTTDERDTVLNYLQGNSTQQTIYNKSSMSENMELNTILFGPPGTGKTFRVQSIIRDNDNRLTEKSAETPKPDLDEFVSGYKWWEVVALALLDSPNNTVKVPELRKHPFILAKAAQNSVKDLGPRLWGTLQHHTVDSCPNVNTATKSGERIFYKEEDSTWRFDNINGFKNNYEVLVDELARFKAPIVGSKPYKWYYFTTCHQSLSYEDFIEGIKPILASSKMDDDEGLSYDIRKGYFYNACNEAAKLAGYTNLIECIADDKDVRKSKFIEANANGKQFYLFLDEINRCNVSSVFGELITLIETDKRLGADNEIADVILPYSQQLFGVPSNLYIVGTMNTADRSVEALDTALRRRFSFIAMEPDYTTLVKEGKDVQIDDISLREVLQTINKRISYLLDNDHKIGHSYFLNIKDDKSLRNAFGNKIIPLMKEYFYNDYEKIYWVLGGGFVEKPKTDMEIFNVPEAIVDSEGRYIVREITDDFPIIEALKTTINVKQ